MADASANSWGPETVGGCRPLCWTEPPIVTSSGASAGGGPGGGGGAPCTPAGGGPSGGCITGSCGATPPENGLHGAQAGRKLSPEANNGAVNAIEQRCGEEKMSESEEFANTAMTPRRRFFTTAGGLRIYSRAKMAPLCDVRCDVTNSLNKEPEALPKMGLTGLERTSS